MPNRKITVYLGIIFIVLCFCLSFLHFREDEDITWQSTNISAQLSHLRKENGVAVKGEALLSNDWIIDQLKPFLQVYDSRPAQENKYGSKLMHQFALWCIIKKLQPKHIIESGIYKGLGTWIIRQAAPDAQLIMIDPYPDSNTIYKDERKNTLYFTKENFVDFGKVKWNFTDPNRTLVFIDDHMYSIRRLTEGRQFGFKHFIFDDNYNGPGDMFPLRMLCKIFLNEYPLKDFKYAEASKRQQWTFNQKKAFEESKFVFGNQIKIYWEFPMIWKCNTCNTNRDNYNVLFNETDGKSLLKKYGLNNLPTDSELIAQYYNIAYVQLI